MSNENKLHVYYISYNLCSAGSTNDLGCLDYKVYARTKNPLNRDSLEQRLGRNGFKFSLDFLEELDCNRISRLDSNLNIIPVID